MFFSHCCAFVLFFFLQVRFFLQTDIERSLLGFGCAKDCETKQFAFILELVTISKSDYLSFVIVRTGIREIISADLFPYDHCVQ